MENEIILKEVNGEALTSSRDVAERFGKRHDKLMSEIERMYSSLIGGVPKMVDTPMFWKTSYIHEQNKQEYPMYEMNRDGFSLLVMGFTGSEALTWKLKYIEAFNKMETRLKEQNAKELPSTYKEALLQLVQQIEENEKLLGEVDRYTRFLCEKTELLKKSELATKLDTNANTLAALFKKLKIYTPKTSQLTESFLEKFPNVKMYDESDESYIDKRTGELVPKKGWQWTFLGAKNLVDYLIDLGHITFTENDGFKLKKTS